MRKKKTNVAEARNKIKQMFQAEMIKELKNLYIDLIATKNNNFLKLIILKPQILINITFRLSKHFKKNYQKLLLFISCQQ